MVKKVALYAKDEEKNSVRSSDLPKWWKRWFLTIYTKIFTRLTTRNIIKAS